MKKGSSSANIAGTTFCGIGALKLLQRTSSIRRDLNVPFRIPGLSEEVSQDLVRWLVSRQTQYINPVDEDLDLPEAEPSKDPSSDKKTPSFHHQETSPAGSSETKKAETVYDYVSRDENLQFTGFNGRCNKVADTCYAFWVGGSLAVLIAHPSFRNVSITESSRCCSKYIYRFLARCVDNCGVRPSI